MVASTQYAELKMTFMRKDNVLLFYVIMPSPVSRSWQWIGFSGVTVYFPFSIQTIRELE